MEATLSIMGMYRYDPTIFDHFRTPENVSRDLCIGEILLQCAELEILYPSADTMKTAIKLWTDKELPIWSELQKTKEYKYNPIFNKEGIEKETETRNLKGTGTGKTAVKGYNNTGWNDSDKNDAESTDTGTVEIVREYGGNIGVTMTQELIEAQREVVKFDIVQYIVDSFRKRFCLLIY